LEERNGCRLRRKGIPSKDETGSAHNTQPDGHDASLSSQMTLNLHLPRWLSLGGEPVTIYHSNKFLILLHFGPANPSEGTVVTDSAQRWPGGWHWAIGGRRSGGDDGA
jgi:hypothetical protein